MPWYYAGPEAKPVGPVSAEQLHALRAAGTISSDTFVIEHTGTSAAAISWKRYGELFPATPPASAAAFPGMPPLPAPGAAPHPTALPPAAPLPPTATHPLFPSAGPVPPAAAHPLFPSAGHLTGYAHIQPTNSWCAWGFAFSLVGFCFSCLCGIGLLPALLAAVLCVIGLVQVNKNPAQSGKGLAITGLVFCALALLIASIFIAIWAPSILKQHGLTVTEQTSNDSE